MRQSPKKYALALLCFVMSAAASESVVAGDFCQGPGDAANSAPIVDPDSPTGNECRQRFRGTPTDANSAEASVLSHALHAGDSELITLNVCGLSELLDTTRDQPSYLSLAEISFTDTLNPGDSYALQLTAALMNGHYYLLVDWYLTSNPALSVSNPEAPIPLSLHPTEVMGVLSATCTHGTSATPIVLDFSLPDGSPGLAVDSPAPGPKYLLQLSTVRKTAMLVRNRVWAGRLAYGATLPGTLELKWWGIED